MHKVLLVSLLALTPVVASASPGAMEAMAFLIYGLPSLAIFTVLAFKILSSPTKWLIKNLGVSAPLRPFLFLFVIIAPSALLACVLIIVLGDVFKFASLGAFSAGAFAASFIACQLIGLFLIRMIISSYAARFEKS